MIAFEIGLAWIISVFIVAVALAVIALKFAPKLRGKGKEGDLSKVKKLIGSRKETYKGEAVKGEETLNAKKLENKIKSLENEGENLEDVKIWLKLYREKKGEGQLHLAERYFEKLKEEIDDLNGS